MHITIKKTMTTLLVLIGILLSSALAQIAQYVASVDDARASTIARYVDVLPPQEQTEVTDAISACLYKKHPSSEKPPISVYACLREKKQSNLATQIQITDEGMRTASWPLSIFW